MSVLGSKSSVATSTAASERATCHAGQKITILGFSLLALAAATFAVGSNAGCEKSAGKDANALDPSRVGLTSDAAFGEPALQKTNKPSQKKKSPGKKAKGKKAKSSEKKGKKATAEKEKNAVLSEIDQKLAEKTESGEAGRKWMLNMLCAACCLLALIVHVIRFAAEYRYGWYRYGPASDVCVLLVTYVASFLCESACTYWLIASDWCCCTSTLLSKDSWIAHKWGVVKAGVQETNAADVDARVVSTKDTEFANTNWDFCARCGAMSCCERASMCYYGCSACGAVLGFIQIVIALVAY